MSLISLKSFWRDLSETGSSLHLHPFTHVPCSWGEGNGNPLEYSCLENPVDREPGGLLSIGSHRVRHNWVTSLSCTGEGNGNLLQYSCLENPRDRETWWAAVYGVTQSWTQAKQLSSSSSKAYSSWTTTFWKAVVRRLGSHWKRHSQTLKWVYFKSTVINH